MEVCYRHPGRETGVACSSCGRPICPDCMTTTSVGMRCPECASDRTKVKTIGSLATQPTVVYVLIGINVAVYLGEMLSGVSATGESTGGSSLVTEGGVARRYIADGELWRLLTSGFLHAGLFHLFFNMFALYILGGMLEPAIGRARFLLVYFVSLLAGSFGALLLEPVAITVGASGAIFGLMAATFVAMRARGFNPMESGLGMWILLNLAITFAIPRISIGGHIGGLLGGALAALLLFELGERRGWRVAPMVPLALVVILGAGAVAGSIAVSSA